MIAFRKGLEIYDAWFARSSLLAPWEMIAERILTQSYPMNHFNVGVYVAFSNKPFDEDFFHVTLGVLTWKPTPDEHFFSYSFTSRTIRIAATTFETSDGWLKGYTQKLKLLVQRT